MAVALNDKNIVALAQASDPKTAIRKAVGDLSKEEVCSDLVLVGTFFRPEKTAGGIIRPVDNLKEDAFQGKVGLVLKLGPDATGGPVIKEDDWIVYSVGDAWSVAINGMACRLVPYDRIRMKVSDPNKVF